MVIELVYLWLRFLFSFLICTVLILPDFSVSKDQIMCAPPYINSPRMFKSRLLLGDLLMVRL